MAGFGQILGEFQEEFGRVWEDLAGFRQKVGWIRQSRADFGGKIVDSRGDLVVCPPAQTWRKRGAVWRNARGPIPNFLSEEF